MVLPLRVSCRHVLKRDAGKVNPREKTKAESKVTLPQQAELRSNKHASKVTVQVTSLFSRGR